MVVKTCFTVELKLSLVHLFQGPKYFGDVSIAGKYESEKPFTRFLYDQQTFTLLEVNLICNYIE